MIVAAVLVFIAGNAVNALNKGGDAQVFFEGGRRLLEQLPLYENSGPAAGFIGPPFQAAFFVPFAIVRRSSDRAARLLWYSLNLLCLGAGVWLWRTAWIAGLARSDQATLHHTRSLWLAVAAILLPLQTNFEHQNMNPLLLAATGGVAWAVATGRSTLAGGLVGLAAALKAFPALLAIHLVGRRLWRACAAAVLACALLTALPLAVYGPGRLARDMSAWLHVGAGGWPTRGSNQSLIAAVDRMVSSDSAAVHAPGEAPGSLIVFAATVAVLAIASLMVVRGRNRNAAQTTCELAGLVTLAVLLSPVAWDHYWVLLFPAFLLVSDGSSPRLLGRAGTAAFWSAAILTTGISRVTAGQAGWAAARRASVSTVAAVILYCALLALWRRLSQPATGR